MWSHCMCVKVCIHILHNYCEFNTLYYIIHDKDHTSRYISVRWTMEHAMNSPLRLKHMIACGREGEVEGQE